MEERNKMIINLTNLRIGFEKRERALKEEILDREEDCRGFDQMIQELQNELENMSTEN